MGLSSLPEGKLLKGEVNFLLVVPSVLHQCLRCIEHSANVCSTKLTGRYFERRWNFSSCSNVEQLMCTYSNNGDRNNG